MTCPGSGPLGPDRFRRLQANRRRPGAVEAPRKARG
jgi:hypothetical protein